MYKLPGQSEIFGMERVKQEHPFTSFSGDLTPSNCGDFGYEWADPPAPPEPQPYVPFSISMRQCQLYLYDLDNGATLAAVAQLAQSMGAKANIEWLTSSEVWRNSPMVELMRQQFGWTTEQMDDMFREANKL